MNLSIDDHILDGCVQIVYKNALAANIAVIVFSSMLAGVLYPELLHTWVLLWLTLTIFAASIRITLWHLYRKSNGKVRPVTWGKRYTAATLFLGFAWASASLLVLDTNSLYVIGAIYIMFIGVMAASLPTSSSVPSIFIAYITPLFIGMVSPYLLLGNRFSMFMSLAALVYYIFLIYVGRNVYQRTKEFLGLQFENQELISQLNDEISVRTNTQRLLENHKEELEAEVSERTKQLSIINESLESEIAERKRAEENLKHLAHHDALTGLPNRLLLDARLKHAIERAHRTNTKVAVFFLDLDHFKNINDSLGHSAGDQLLQSIGQKLNACIREDDTVARLGGDEFIVILEQVHSTVDVHELAKKILNAITTESDIGEHRISTTASIGISLYPDDGKELDDLIRNSDAAMYKAKGKGRHNYQFYTKDLTAAAYHRVMLENDLRRAIDNNELEVYYQPQLTLYDRRVFGVEALVRWNHPKLGLLAPAEFLPVAEDTGLIVPLGEWVLRTACKQMVSWKSNGQSLNTLAVNLSGAQLSNINLVETVGEILKETHCQADWLELEITEDFVMKETSYAISSLNALRDLGIDIAIDDFGTGYSSLSYLKTLPINKLKIDRSFIQDIGRDTEDNTIISAIIAMAKNMNLDIIAEGIENESQEAFLKTQQCNAGQGYMYARPMNVKDLNEYLAK